MTQSSHLFFFDLKRTDLVRFTIIRVDTMKVIAEKVGWQATRYPCGAEKMKPHETLLNFLEGKDLRFKTLVPKGRATQHHQHHQHNTTTKQQPQQQLHHQTTSTTNCTNTAHNHTHNHNHNQPQPQPTTTTPTTTTITTTTTTKTTPTIPTTTTTTTNHNHSLTLTI